MTLLVSLVVVWCVTSVSAVAGYGIRTWREVKLAELKHAKEAAERLDRATKRFYEQLTGGEVRSDNLRPLSEVARPHFGMKPHVAVDNDKPPEGAA